jgi:hypothetical protein
MVLPTDFTADVTERTEQLSDISITSEEAADYLTNGQASDPDESVDVFSPSLFTSFATFGLISQDEAESAGIPETTSTDELSGEAEGSIGIAGSLRLIAFALVAGAAIYVVGQLFTFEIPVGQ